MSSTPPPPPPPSPPPPPPPPMSEQSGATTVGDAELASSGMRLLARILDGLIVGALFGGIFAAIILSGDDGAGVAGFGLDASFGETYALALLGAATGFVWDAVCTKQFGGTPMKIAFGMRVIRSDTGGDVEWEHAIKRWAVPGALALIPPLVALNVLTGLAQLVIVIVSLVFLFSKPLRQTVWDLFAGTLVVKRR